MYHLKGTLNQVTIIALSDLKLLRQILENTILHSIKYRYLEIYFIFTR